MINDMMINNTPVIISVAMMNSNTGNESLADSTDTLIW